MKRFGWMLLPVALAIVSLGPGTQAQTPDAASEGDAVAGKELFLKNYCWSCHGYVGAGASTGPRLAQTPYTSEGFTAFIRNPGRMPPYRVAVLSDSEAADIFAYIRTFPAPPPLEDIPLLDLD
jgi:ubiquinol-cytochrome c reductase cytochrome c subunit